MNSIFVRFLILFTGSLWRILRSDKEMAMENLALRQQLAVYEAGKIKPRITDTDRSFWIDLKEVWGKWQSSLIIVKPETVIDWQKRRFKKYWRKISERNKRHRHKQIKKEIGDLWTAKAQWIAASV